MFPFSLFKKKQKQNFYKFPSLESGVDKDELYSLLKTSDIDKNTKRIIKQARSLSIANALISGYLKTARSEILGDKGFILDIDTPNEATNKRIEKLYNDWARASELFNCINLAVLYLLRDGELFLYADLSRGLELKNIDPLDIDHDFNDETKNIKYGIEFKNSTPAAYYFKEGEKLKRIEAKYIIHYFDRHDIKQVRGISNLASVIHLANLQDKFKIAELQRARLQSTITGYFINSDNTGLSEEETEIKDRAEVGKMQYIDANLKPYFIESHNPTNIEFFIKESSRSIAKALGISYHALTGDLREVNYSSLRQGGLEQRRHYKFIQNNFINGVMMKVLRMFLDLNNFSEALNYSNFKTQGWEYIDPFKETRANTEALKYGLSTYQDILKQKGKELSTHLKEIEQEKQLRELLNNN